MTELRFRSSWLAERRVAAGHTTLSLGAHLGESATTVRYIEGGLDPEHVEFGLLVRYADALGCRIDDLFEAPPDVEPVDVAQVVGVVAAAGHITVDVLAEALGWSLERCRDTLIGAGGRLREVGLALSWMGDMAVTLVPAADVEVPSVELARRSIENHGGKVTHTRVLAKLARAGKLNRSDDRVATKQLLDAGLVELAPGTKLVKGKNDGVRAAVRLTNEAKFNLVL